MLHKAISILQTLMQVQYLHVLIQFKQLLLILQVILVEIIILILIVLLSFPNLFNYALAFLIV